MPPSPSSRAPSWYSQDAATKQIVATIGGKPFTTYQYGPKFPEKPAFYPVIAPNGARVNREYPMVAEGAGRKR